jgi:RNA polymerase sigma-70 factor (ECF subfamily)
MELFSDASDTNLVLAVARYEQQALTEVYRRHGGAVLALSTKILGSRALAEEVTQEIFIKLWNDPGRFDPERGSLRSFLLSGAHSRSIDLIRSESARRVREERDARQMLSPPNDLDREIMELTTSEYVRQALDDIHPREREAIELAYYRGLTYKEVAVVLDEPEGTIKSRIRAGLKHLGALLVEVEL